MSRTAEQAEEEKWDTQDEDKVEFNLTQVGKARQEMYKRILSTTRGFKFESSVLGGGHEHTVISHLRVVSEASPCEAFCPPPRLEFTLENIN